MSVFLTSGNWLVADWVMRKLNQDLSIIDEERIFFNIKSELDKGEQLYTFLLDYSTASLLEVNLLAELVNKILQGYRDKRLMFSGSIEAFAFYIQKLEELQDLAEKSDNKNHDA